MKKAQKERVTELRLNGASYGEIAEMTGIKKETIKSHCLRHGIVKNGNKQCCLRCHKPLPEQTAGRKRRFCSDACRWAWNYAQRAAKREAESAEVD
ncbi:MAG: hypothetical protein LBM18_01075 [Oscillospiraceae bacterium]|nr:hypothetical protein [Oscillospiraceae bacterium]